MTTARMTATLRIMMGGLLDLRAFFVLKNSWFRSVHGFRNQLGHANVSTTRL